MVVFWRKKWQPTPVFLPEKSHGLRILVGYSPWGRKESDNTEQLHFTSLLVRREEPQRAETTQGHTRKESESESRSVLSDSVIPWTIQSMEFSRPEYWGEWPFPSSRRSSQLRDQTQVSCICRQILYQLSHKGSPGHLEAGVIETIRKLACHRKL